MSNNNLLLEDVITLDRLQDFLSNCDNRYIPASNPPDFGLSINGHTISIVSGGNTKSVTVPDNDTTYTPASANPVMDGTAAVGTSVKYAREDHVHPTDTSRASASALTSHTEDTTAHITASERTLWNTYSSTATGSVNGLMSAADKTKLDGISSMTNSEGTAASSTTGRLISASELRSQITYALQNLTWADVEPAQSS